jgi:hypothetical protein
MCMTAPTGPTAVLTFANSIHRNAPTPRPDQDAARLMSNPEVG